MPNNQFSEFDEFDLALSLYHWLQHNWTSQSDPLYSDFCLLTNPGMYRPSHSLQFFNNIDDMAKNAYDSLTLDNYKLALNRVFNYKPVDL